MHKSMRVQAFAILVVILLSIAIPVSAADEERYGYITVQDVTVHLKNDTAVINVNYSVDEGTRIIFFLLGKQDLKNKLYHILNYDGAQMQRVNLPVQNFLSMVQHIPMAMEFTGIPPTHSTS